MIYYHCSYESGRYRLRPVVRLTDNFYYGWEVINAEKPVQQIIKKPLAVLKAHDEFMLFLRKIDSVAGLDGTFFINLTAIVLTDDKLTDIISLLNHRKQVVITLSDTDLVATACDSVKEMVFRNIKTLRGAGWSVWLNMKTCALSATIKNAGVDFDGIKIPVNAVMRESLIEAVTFARQLSTNIIIDGINEEYAHFRLKELNGVLGQGNLWKELTFTHNKEIVPDVSSSLNNFPQAS